MKYQVGDVVKVVGFDNNEGIVSKVTSSTEGHYLVKINGKECFVPRWNIIGKTKSIRQQAIEKEMEMIQERIEKLMEKKKQLHIELSKIT